MIVPASMPGRRRFLAFNPLNEEIPPHAAVEWNVVDQLGAFILRKPDKDDSNTAYLNTEASIPRQSYGFITKHLPAWAKYNPADGDPVNGESLGTRTGFWDLHRGYEGFLVWGGADGEKVYVQSDLTCREAGGDQYYYDYYGMTRSNNPTYANACCAQQLSSILYGNVVGTNSHDTGVMFKRWNGGASNPIPWYPSWLNTILGNLAGWFSPLYEDFQCVRQFDFTETISGVEYHFVVDYTETFYFLVGFTGTGACYPWLLQVVDRQGSWSRTSTPYGTENFVVDQQFQVGNLGITTPTSCNDPECDPFYMKKYVKNSAPNYGVISSCPTVNGSALGFYNFLSWDIDAGLDFEPSATCSPFPFVGSGPFIEVFPSSDPGSDPPWNPPPAP